ncbi:MAG: ParB/RepB/Spo0J family partition protein [Prevotella sp.]|nr:ParB/RepB/Spo0J family partition protein [Prevotella sp.]
MAVKKKYASNVLGRGLDDIGSGRGLDALIDTSNVVTRGSSNLNEISISQIEPNPDQPRREFDPEALQELAESIKTMGIIAPITLRQVAENRYQIIAGERRWRASQMAGLTTIPAYIRTVEDENVMEMALVENIQREDLNAIEIALAYQHLVETTGLTQSKISERVGKSRAAVTNYLRLLKLPAQVQMALKDKKIDMGHARALLAIESPTQQIKLFNEIQKQGYSVRKVEEMAQMLKNGEDVQTVKRAVGHHPLPKEYGELCSRLSDFFQTKVQMSCSPRGKGKINISFNDEDELERIMNLLDKSLGH